MPYVRQVLPPNPQIYVEPFGGGGAILLGLPPSPKRLDIYNDLNENLVNLFLCTKERHVRLLKELDYLPLQSRAEFEMVKAAVRHDAYAETLDFSEDELEAAQESFPPEEAEELAEIIQERRGLMDVRRAAAFYKMQVGSFSGTGSSFGIKSCPIEKFYHLINAASRRLRTAVIESKDALQLIRDMDDDDVLFYCDPPYTGAEKFYAILFEGDKHIQLHDVLTQCRGFVVVSYNDCEYIRDLYRDFFILAFKRNNPLAQQKGSSYKELILTNYDPRSVIPQANLFEHSGIFDDMELVHIPERPLKAV